MFQGTCPHCGSQFTARSPFKKFCKPSHRVAFCVKLQKQLGREGVAPKPTIPEPSPPLKQEVISPGDKKYKSVSEMLDDTLQEDDDFNKNYIIDKSESQ